MVYCTLKKYLAELEVAEKTRVRRERRHVPTLAEISRDIGMSYRAITKIANNHTVRLDYRTAAKIIKSIRKHGHDMKIHHLIDFAPEESVKAEA